MIDGKSMPRDWDTIVSYYYEHYKSIMERLFKENGHELKMEEKPVEQTTGNAVPTE
jgi:hypothetical protein